VTASTLASSPCRAHVHPSLQTGGVGLTQLQLRDFSFQLQCKQHASSHLTQLMGGNLLCHANSVMCNYLIIPLNILCMLLCISYRYWLFLSCSSFTQSWEKNTK